MAQKVVFNNIIPFSGFMAVNLFGTIFCRKAWKNGMETETYKTMLTHESIHTAQMKELLYVGFYLLYFLEWIYRLFFHTRTAYKGISFEKEAFGNEKDSSYLATRKAYAQWRK